MVSWEEGEKRTLTVTLGAGYFVLPNAGPAVPNMRAVLEQRTDIVVREVRELSGGVRFVYEAPKLASGVRFATYWMSMGGSKSVTCEYEPDRSASADDELRDRVCASMQPVAQ
jgi:hypothetical protein